MPPPSGTHGNTGAAHCFRFVFGIGIILTVWGLVMVPMETAHRADQILSFRPPLVEPARARDVATALRPGSLARHCLVTGTGLALMIVSAVGIRALRAGKGPA